MSNLIAALILALSALLLKFVYSSKKRSDNIEEPLLVISKNVNVVVQFIVFAGIIMAVVEAGFRLYSSTFTLFHGTKTLFFLTFFYFLYYINVAKIYFSNDAIVYGNGDFKYNEIKDVMWFDSGFAITYEYKKNDKRYSFMIDMQHKDDINSIFDKNRVKRNRK
ncbi:MAG: hypothetical protein WBA54_10210 [Acidaminobacteraceae bacterium]